MKPQAVLDEIDQIEAHFKAREAEVRAFVPEAGRFDRLRREWRDLLDQYPRPEERPALFGTLVGVKDTFRVDGLPTRAGSHLPPELFAGQEAESVTRLKQAGALILGKTVTTEFAYFAPGPTRNPHNLAHTPGGSSSGSAAGVAAGLCQLALGTQTIGSTVRPAAFCGVVGYKLSYNRVSQSGVILLSPSLDHVGLFAANVEGVRRAASLLCREWRSEIETRRPSLGIPEGPYLNCASEEGLAHFRSNCEQLRAIGYGIKLVPTMPDFETIRHRHDLIIAAEAARIHADWFARYGELYHPTTADLVRRGQSVSSDELADALQACTRLRDELTTLMDANHIDLWITPSAPGPAPAGLDRTGDPVMNLPWTQSGLPALNLPAGTNAAGLPLGVQLVAGWYQDEALLAWAAEIARALVEVRETDKDLRLTWPKLS